MRSKSSMRTRASSCASCATWQGCERWKLRRSFPEITTIPESWRNWSDKAKQEEHIKRFKRKFASDQNRQDRPAVYLVVINMLLTGFDAPVEQVLYLDRKIVAHDLLQAIARVNRTSGQKKCGYVVDYIGVARHLNEALQRLRRRGHRRHADRHQRRVAKVARSPRAGHRRIHGSRHHGSARRQWKHVCSCSRT